MPSNYIVKLKNNKLFCFYNSENKGILFKLFENNKWSEEQTLLPNTNDNFTVSLDNKGFIYLFCQNINGDIILCTNKEGDWSKKIILKNQLSGLHKVLMYSIISEYSMNLIYNTSLKENKGNILMVQSVNESGAWGPALHIDNFYNTGEQMYNLQMVTYNHGVLFYQTRTSENILGYREITPEKFGTYYSFLKTAFQILDTSYLTTYSSIHVLYIIKNLFSTYLIYRKKDDKEFSQPITLCEAPRINNCLLFIANNNLYASFINNGHLYICSSEDKGDTFSRPSRYENKVCSNLIKSNFISEDIQQENNYLARQVYVDKSAPWDIQVLPNMYTQFYPVPNSISNDTDEEVHIQSNNNSAKDIKKEKEFDSLEDINNLKSIIKLKNSEILEKDNQINYMTDVMKKKLDNFKQLEEDYKFSIQKLEDDNKELIKDIKNLQDLLSKNVDLNIKNNTANKVKLNLVENVKSATIENNVIT